MNWIGQEWHKLTAALILITQWFVHWDDISEKVKRLSGIKTYIERRISERRHTMLNPLTLVADLAKLEKAVNTINNLLPLVPKALLDVQAVVAAKNDPTAEVAALAALLQDFQTACGELTTAVQPTAPVA